MTGQIDRRDVFSYAEGRRLAERERAIAMRMIWKGLVDYVRRRPAAPGPAAPGPARGSQPPMPALGSLPRGG